MNRKKEEDINKLLEKVKKVTVDNKLDLSYGEDLSIGIMNLIAIEEHMFFTAEKTKDRKYFDLLNEVRLMRTELMKDIVKDYGGEIWCTSKHLLVACMRLIESGTKILKKGDKNKAYNLFDKAYNLYSLFWGLNLGVVKTDNAIRDSKDEKEINLISEKGEKSGSASVFSKLGTLVQKVLDCCRE
jgi:hypothetical protein